MKCNCALCKGALNPEDILDLVTPTRRVVTVPAEGEFLVVDGRVHRVDCGNDYHPDSRWFEGQILKDGDDDD